MNLFRSHIPRLYLTLTLLVSLAAHYLQPVNKPAKYTAFTTWLSTHLKNNQNESVRHQIRELGNTAGALESVIRNASVFIETNADDFELRFSKTNSDEIFRHLLSEWISYLDSQQGMAKGVIVTSPKPVTLLQNDSPVLAGLSPVKTYASRGNSYHSLSAEGDDGRVLKKQSPLSFGIGSRAP